jgi:hypothetical protein
VSLSRRNFVRGALLGGGAALVMPWGKQVARAGAGSCRFLFIVEGNCYEPVTVLSDTARAALDDTLDAPLTTERWWHNRYRHDAPIVLDTPDLASARSLGALADHGLVDQTTVLLGLSSRIIGGGHSGYHGALSSTRTIGGRPAGVTIDAHLAALETVRGETPFDAVRLGVGSRPLDFGTCAYTRGRSAPMILDPVAAYNFIYGAFGGPDARASFEARDRMLRFAQADVRAARETLFLGAEEAGKLSTHDSSIAALLETQDRLLSMDVTAPPPPAGGLDAIAWFGAQLDLAAGALMDGLTNVAVVGSGTGGAFGLTYSTVSSTDRHNMHHESGGSAAMRDAVHDVTAAQVGEIGRVVRRLADTPDPSGGTMLDHTVVVWIGDNGEQHHSTASDFPVVMFGGTSLGLQGGGRTILYPGTGGAGHRQVSNLWNTMGYLAGQTLDDFGAEEGDLRKAFGPLPELLG